MVGDLGEDWVGTQGLFLDGRPRVLCTLGKALLPSYSPSPGNRFKNHSKMNKMKNIVGSGIKRLVWFGFVVLF